MDCQGNGLPWSLVNRKFRQLMNFALDQAGEMVSLTSRKPICVQGLTKKNSQKSQVVIFYGLHQKKSLSATSKSHWIPVFVGQITMQLHHGLPGGKTSTIFLLLFLFFGLLVIEQFGSGTKNDTGNVPHNCGCLRTGFPIYDLNIKGLVVDLPLWKIWARQLGWWHSQDMESKKKSNGSSHHQPVMGFFSLVIFWLSLIANGIFIGWL